MPRDRRIIEVEEKKPELDMNNIDMNQIAGMMKNIDFNQLSSMMSALGGADGIGNILGGLAGSGGIGNILGGLAGSGGLGSILGGLAGSGGLGSILGGLSGLGDSSQADKYEGKREYRHNSGDRRIDVLYALKPLVSPERASLIDMILQLYIISKILRGLR